MQKLLGTMLLLCLFNIGVSSVIADSRPFSVACPFEGEVVKFKETTAPENKIEQFELTLKIKFHTFVPLCEGCMQNDGINDMCYFLEGATITGTWFTPGQPYTIEQPSVDKTKVLMRNSLIKGEIDSFDYIIKNVTLKPIDALWISTYFFMKPDKIYLDLQRNGEFLSTKQEVEGKIEVRFGSLTQDVINRAFKVIETKGFLNAKDLGATYEPTPSELVKVGMVVDGKIRSSQLAPIEDFPSDFQQLLKDLKFLAERQPLAQNIKALVVAELVDSQRAQSIKDDPRKFFAFVKMGESDFVATPSVGNAIGALGRQVPLRDNAELQKVKEYIKFSNLKSTNKEFFITWDGKTYQLQLLLIQ